MKIQIRDIRVCALLILSSICHLKSDTRLIAYLQHAPVELLQEVEQEAQEEKLIEKLDSVDQKIPSYIAKRQVKSRLREILKPHQGGILSLYAGYSDYSNNDGLIKFPLRHSGDKIYVAISENVKLVKTVSNTISHIEFLAPEVAPAELYEMNKKVDEAEITYWEVKKIPLPENKIIPATSLIILTKPKNIIIPEGDALSVKTNHLVLPPIYLVGNNNYVQTVTRLLNIQQYFEPMDVIRQKSGETIVQERLSNI